MLTTASQARGTQPGNNSLPAAYGDSTAVMKGIWYSNQSVAITIAVNGTDSSSAEELECRLRSNLGPTNAQCYEINASVKTGNAYIQVVRWNGGLGDFTLLNSLGIPVANGYVLKAAITNNVITVYTNNVLCYSVDDTTYISTHPVFVNGNPGMGAFMQGGVVGNDANFGISQFTADGLISGLTNNATVGGGVGALFLHQ